MLHIKLDFNLNRATNVVNAGYKNRKTRRLNRAIDKYDQFYQRYSFIVAKFPKNDCEQIHFLLSLRSRQGPRPIPHTRPPDPTPILRSPSAHTPPPTQNHQKPARSLATPAHTHAILLLPTPLSPHYSGKSIKGMAFISCNKYDLYSQSVHSIWRDQEEKERIWIYFKKDEVWIRRWSGL